MRNAPPRTRILAVVAIAVVIAAGLYFFKLHKSGSAAPPLPAATAPISFVTRANAVCNLESQDRLRRAAAIVPVGVASRTAFAAFDASVRGSVKELPKLLTITPPPAAATLWDRYLQVNGDVLSVLVRLRSLARHHAGQAQLTSASAPLTRLYTLQRAFAVRLGLMACANSHPVAASAAPSTSPSGASAATAASAASTPAR